MSSEEGPTRAGFQLKQGIKLWMLHAYNVFRRWAVGFDFSDCACAVHCEHYIANL